MNVAVNQLEKQILSAGDFRTLTKDDVMAQTRYINHSNSEDESWFDNEETEGFNHYIEEYE